MPAHLHRRWKSGRPNLRDDALSAARLVLWDPAKPQSAPQLLVGGAETGEQPFDALPGQRAALSNVFCSVIGRTGRLWALDHWDSIGGKRVICVGTSLVPPAYLTAAQPAPDDSNKSWKVAGNAAAILAAYEHPLASGEGADVHILVQGEVAINAHSLPLCTQSEWFRARLGPWREAAGAAAGSSAAGGSSSRPVCAIDAQDIPPAVMRALLQFVYTGQVVLEAAEQGQEQGQEIAASSQQPPAKRARKGGKGTDKGSAGQGSSQQQQAEDATAAADGEQQQPHVLLAQLLHAAQIYGVPQLHAACLELARARISVHCALPWLAYAHEQAEQELKQLALGWAAEHYAGIISSAPETLEVIDELPGRLVRELMHAALEAGVQLPAGDKQGLGPQGQAGGNQQQGHS